MTAHHKRRGSPGRAGAHSLPRMDYSARCSKGDVAAEELLLPLISGFKPGRWSLEPGGSISSKQRVKLTAFLRDQTRACDLQGTLALMSPDALHGGQRRTKTGPAHSSPGGHALPGRSPGLRERHSHRAALCPRSRPDSGAATQTLENSDRSPDLAALQGNPSSLGGYNATMST